MAAEPRSSATIGSRGMAAPPPGRGPRRRRTPGTPSIQSSASSELEDGRSAARGRRASAARRRGRRLAARRAPARRDLRRGWPTASGSAPSRPRAAQGPGQRPSRPCRAWRRRARRGRARTSATSARQVGPSRARQHREAERLQDGAHQGLMVRVVVDHHDGAPAARDSRATAPRHGGERAATRGQHQPHPERGCPRPAAALRRRSRRPSARPAAW